MREHLIMNEGKNEINKYMKMLDDKRMDVPLKGELPEERTVCK